MNTIKIEIKGQVNFKCTIKPKSMRNFIKHANMIKEIAILFEESTRKSEAEHHSNPRPKGKRDSHGGNAGSRENGKPRIRKSNTSLPKRIAPSKLKKRYPNKNKELNQVTPARESSINETES